MEAIIESVKQTQYINIPNPNFDPEEEGSTQFITQKRIIIDDVNSFFTNFLQQAQNGKLTSKEDDLMI